jgi:hypothetical protein
MRALCVGAIVAVAACGAAPSLDASAQMDLAAAACTRVIGYSQTSQWYLAAGVFESLVDNGAWELQWTNGATLEEYRQANSEAWRAPVRSPCVGGVAPDRVVFTIAGQYADDAAAWAAAMGETLANLRALHPTVRTIVLQPIVGGPKNGACTLGGEAVQAAASHPYQDAAIAAAVGGDVVAGPSPEVRSCADYRDALGHLTVDGARAAGETLGAFYRAF